MNERVVEILIYLMTEIRENRGGMEQVDGISKDLKQQGYTENEINAAFSWLFELYITVNNNSINIFFFII